MAAEALRSNQDIAALVRARPRLRWLSEPPALQSAAAALASAFPPGESCTLLELETALRPSPARDLASGLFALLLPAAIKGGKGQGGEGGKAHVMQVGTLLVALRSNTRAWTLVESSLETRRLRRPNAIAALAAFLGSSAYCTEASVWHVNDMRA